MLQITGPRLRVEPQSPLPCYFVPSCVVKHVLRGCPCPEVLTITLPLNKASGIDQITQQFVIF